MKRCSTEFCTSFESLTRLRHKCNHHSPLIEGYTDGVFDLEVGIVWTDSFTDHYIACPLGESSTPLIKFSFRPVPFGKSLSAWH